MPQTPFQRYSKFYAPESEQHWFEPVDITDWSFGGDFNPYADGTRAKFEIWCPGIDSLDYSFLIPKHRYLYKRTFERLNRRTGEAIIFSEQFWVEIIAYHVGRLLGVEVPPAFIACRQLPETGEMEYASLIEWYYGYPGADEYEVDRGGDYMSRLIPNYDRDKGRQHNFQSIRQICESEGVENWLQSWVKILVFDVIIGNVDRHQENWEVLTFPDEERVEHSVMSPAFDNGTAMGQEILNRKIAGKMQNLPTYIAKGYHHMKWQIDDPKQAGHFDLLEKLITAFPETQSIMAKLLHKNISGIDTLIHGLREFDIRNENYRLSEERADFMIALIHARHKKAKEVIGI